MNVKMENIFFSGTFSGETLSIAASIAVIDKIKREPVISKLWKTGSYLASEVVKIIEKNGLGDIISLNGLDPWKIINVSHKSDLIECQIKTFLIQEMLFEGVLLTSSHNISYAHNSENIDNVIRAYTQYCQKLGTDWITII